MVGATILMPKKIKADIKELVVYSTLIKIYSGILYLFVL